MYTQQSSLTPLFLTVLVGSWLRSWHRRLCLTIVHARSLVGHSSHVSNVQDPQIFTDCIKPHFEYYSPPLERFRQPQARPYRYAYVEPVAAFHDALNKAAALPAKAVGAAGKAVGAAGKAVGAAGMAVLHFGSSHQGSQPSTAKSDDTRKSEHRAATSRWGASASGSGLQPVSEPAEDSAKPKIDVLKTFGVPEFLPDF